MLAVLKTKPHWPSYLCENTLPSVRSKKYYFSLKMEDIYYNGVEAKNR